MEQELKTALIAAKEELERLRYVLSPEFDGKIGEPDTAIINQCQAALDRKPTLEEENKEIIEGFFSQLNIMGNERVIAKQLTEHIAREHRTLQQNFFRVMKQVIESYAKSTPYKDYDLRNEDSKIWAAKVAKAGANDNLRYV